MRKVLFAGALVLGVIGAIAYTFMRREQTTSDATRDAGVVARVEAEPALRVGPVDARYVLEEYSDYECPFCATDFIATAAGIREFVERRGNIGYAFYDVVGPGHPNGLAASIAARCAGAQGGYEEARLSLFARQSDWAATAVTPIPAATVVAPLILNEPAFSQCVRSDTTMARVEKVLAANLRRALSLGVTKTPTWVVWRDTTPQLLRGAIDSIRLAALLQ